MKYGSVCSGIEAATVAWHSLGWKPAWFSEIEKFPSAVLAQRWPDVANLGDMTKIATTVRAGSVEAPDILVGGTPCQAFSIAGLRNGLADERGQLTLSYVELADAIDDKRRDSGEEEAIIVWENVPGVLSSKDNAFGCFIGALAGEDCELQPPGGKWPNAGCVYGPARIVTWRVLDAQFFGLAQRRRRVFVVASARNGFDPAAVLFEPESVRRDSPPSRIQGENATASAGESVAIGSHWDNPANPHPTLNQSNNTGGIGASNQEIFSQRGGGIISCMAHGQSGAEIKIDNTCPTLTCNHEAPIVSYGIPGNWIGRSPENGGNATEPPLEISPCLTSTDRHGVAYGFQSRIARNGRGDMGDICHALSAQSGGTGKGDTAPCVAVAIKSGMEVRRLTPVECERLQGFPDNHTRIAWRGKEEDGCPDGQRYRSIGNSMAVPVMHWLGQRIQQEVDKAQPEPAREYARPFLKWAGGKFSLLGELDKYIPAGKRLIEPFVGAGSVFLNSSKHAEFLLADVNADLINLYQMLSVVPQDVIEESRQMFENLNDQKNYLEQREKFNEQRLDAVERATVFLYLNRHCFNGLTRYNQSNQFNVGYGKYKAPYFPEEEIRKFAAMAHNCVFLVAGFERTLSFAGAGDVVYCDPPYEPLPGTNGFTSYTAGGFSWDDQVALVKACVAAHKRGASVVISNSSAPRVIELYEEHGFKIHYVNARRGISCSGSTRETATDIVAVL